MKVKDLEQLVVQIAYENPASWTEEEFDRIAQRYEKNNFDTFDEPIDILKDELIDLDEDKELISTLDKLIKSQKRSLDAAIVFSVLVEHGGLGARRFTKMKRYTDIPFKSVLYAIFNTETENHRLDTQLSMRDQLFYRLVDKFVKPMLKPYLKDPELHEAMLEDVVLYSDLSLYNYQTSKLFKYGNMSKEFTLLFDHFIYYLNLPEVEEKFSEELRLKYAGSIFLRSFVKRPHPNPHLERTYIRPLITSAIDRPVEEKSVEGITFSFEEEL